MGTVKLGRSNSCARSLDYANKRAVEKDGINCDTENVKDTKFEMKQVQEIYQKQDKTQAHTVIQTFSPEESKKLTPQQVNQMGIELAKEIAPSHQVAVYTHADKEHLHNHIIINSVDFETGKKYHHNNDFDRVKAVNDEICKKHNLKIIQPEKHHEKLTSAEVQIKRRDGTPWKDDVRKRIDEIMRDRSVNSYQAFTERLEKKGIKVHERGKNVTYELLEGHRKVRGNKLGSSYEKDTIKQTLKTRELTYENRLTKAKTISKKPRIPVSNKNTAILDRKIKRPKRVKNIQMQKKKGTLTVQSPSKYKGFKASKSLEMMSPLSYWAPVKVIAKTISKGISLSL